MIRAGLVVVAVLVATAAASICYAQTAASVAPSQLTGKQHQLNIDSFEYVWTTVRDKHGKIISNLAKDDFVLEEDGRPQNINYFVRESDQPLRLGKLHEASPTARPGRCCPS